MFAGAVASGRRRSSVTFQHIRNTFGAGGSFKRERTPSNLGQGSRDQKEREKNLEQLVEESHFTKEEVQQIYRSFKTTCPRKVLSLESFTEQYIKFYPQGDATKYAEVVFNCMRRRSAREEVVGFQEFFLTLSLLSRGTTNEQLDWIFDLYDVDGDGVVSQEDIHAVVEAVHEMVGNCATPQWRPEMVERQSDETFERLNVWEEDQISRKAFLTACQRNRSLVASLAHLDTQIAAA